MKNYELVSWYETQIQDTVAAFSHALNETELNFTSGSLSNLLGSSQDVSTAVTRAMLVCLQAGLPVQRHFRIFYTFNHNAGQIESNWKLSKLAYCLALINGHPGHPVVSRMQVALIYQILHS